MTVNTLGTGSEQASAPFASQDARRTRTVAERMWPCLVGGFAVFAVTALIYFHFHREEIQVQTIPQHLIAFLYDSIGLAAGVVLFLWVACWSLIWLATGVLDRPLQRAGRLLVMACMLSIFLNLGDGGVASGAHKGAFGGFMAGRLVAGIGYVPTLILVWVTTFASLLLATDFFFSEYFERMRGGKRSEDGVETAVTDHLRSLSDDADDQRGKVARPTFEAVEAAAAAAAIAEAEDEQQGEADGTEIVAEPVSQEALPAPSQEAEEPDTASEQVVEADSEPRRLSYSERRRQREARRASVVVEAESVVDEEPAQPEAVGEEAAPASAAVSEDELRDLFGNEEDLAAVAAAIDAEWSGDAEAGEDEEVDDDEEVEAVAEEEEEEEEVGEDEEEVDEEEEADEDEELDEEEEADEDEELDEEEEGDEDEEFDEEEEVDDDEEVDEEEEVDEDEELNEEEEADEDEELDEEEEVDEDEELDEEEEVDEDEEELDEDEQGVRENEEPVGLEPQVVLEAPEPIEPPVAIPRPEPQPVAEQAPDDSAASRQQALFGGLDEELIADGTEVVSGARRVTAAMLQRKLRIDYDLARELMAELSSRGVLGK